MSVAVAQNILKNPSSFVTMGSKPRKLRTLSGFMRGIGWASAVYTASLFGMNYHAVHSHQAERVVFDTQVESIQWTDLDNNPWTLGGFSEDGQRFSAVKMTDAWRKAGINPQDIAVLYKLSSVFTPTLYGRDSQALKQDLENKKQIVLDTLQDTLPEVYENLVTGQEVKMTPQEEREWNKIRDKVIRSESAMLDDEISPIRLKTGTSRLVSMKEAKLLLEKAVSETGLASVSLPLSYWESPQMIQGSALRLIQANKDLQKVTGLEGKVLGLNGDIALQIRLPMIDGASGLFSASPMAAHMETTWQSLGHEWFHALDNKVMRSQTPYGIELASQYKEGQNFWNRVKEKAAFVKQDKWVELFDKKGKEVGAAAPEWNQMLNSYLAASSVNKDLSNVHEMQHSSESYNEKLAYSFVSYLSLHDARSLYEINPFANEMTISPGKEDALAQRKVFDDLFEEMKRSPIAKQLRHTGQSRLVAMSPTLK